MSKKSEAFIDKYVVGNDDWLLKHKEVIAKLLDEYETEQCNIPVVRHSCEMITEEYVYRSDFRFQRTQKHGIWFVTYQNHLITFGQYRHDLEEWVDSNYA